MVRIRNNGYVDGTGSMAGDLLAGLFPVSPLSVAISLF